jgi:CMP-N-acetylneuraminic acid synthetase
MKILGIITARGGSKRVPRKNIRDFCGKPLLAWSIDVGRESGVFDRFILSTDDPEIAEVGRASGVEVPFLRPAEFATDTASSFSVIKHAVDWFRERQGYEAPWILLLEPSSPGRQARHLREVAELLRKDPPFDSVVGISETPGHFSPQKALILESDHAVVRYGDREIIRNLTHRNQDVAKTYYINSSLYAFRTKNLSADPPSLWGDRTHGYLMDGAYAMDIDTPEDWAAAEAKMRNLLAQTGHVSP